VWALLLLTLPTQPNAVRLRVWRALKTLGCAALRDGAYVLPASEAARFQPLVSEVREHGGTASMLDIAPRDEAQRQEIEALFDRAEGYAAWRESAQQLLAALQTLGEAEARRRLRAVSAELEALQAIDFYPGAASAQADIDLQTLRAALEERFSKGEPAARAGHGIERLDARRFRGKRWVTRRRPWVDRLACAWLVRRFIDPAARFLWLDDPAGTTPPRGAIGFDYDGARFTHVGARVSFEVMAASFGLDADLRLQRIARAVHYLDVGGIPVPEASGLEAVLAGLREVHADDDELVAAAAQVFDALHAAPAAAT
jgi:hypothetical protein